MKEKIKLHTFENLFYEYPFRHTNPLRTLFHLYKGNKHKLLLATIFFVIKHSPVWVLPIVTANIINIVSRPDRYNIHEAWVNIFVMLVMIIQNIPTHTLYTRFLSQAVRNVESMLRSALIRRLQQLSITFHNETQTGKLQSKVLRDVEAVEALSRQLMNSLLPSLLSIVVALFYTISKNYFITIFFLVTVPISTLLIFSFREKIGIRNREYRKEIEEMATRVSESIQMIPITRAHGLEKI